MRYPSYDPAPSELDILKYWKDNHILEDLRLRNKNKEKFYFLEGPPYTSGNIHLGHAWNMALKDIVLRYKRMCSFDVFDRMGYDMHGLPTEQKVMTKLGLKNKEDIINFGLDRFMRECYQFCTQMMHQMNQDFERLGCTLDNTNPYQPISREFMESEWWLIKQAHLKGRLYQGLRTMHWDAATQSAVAKHELEYKTIKDTAIYIKFPLKSRRNTYLLVWTTTPWTIPLNLAVMANPNLTYAEFEVDSADGAQRWICAAELVDRVLEKCKIARHKIIKTYPGSSLQGSTYTHPLDTISYLPSSLQSNPQLFTVLMTEEYVDSSTGTGLVHCAPGCGPEDYEVGHLHHLPPFNCVNEEGIFENFGSFTGLRAKTDDPKFITAIKNSGCLLAKENYVHDYPHGERSHEPVIFRTTKQWFFKIEDLKDKLLEANEHIYWNPATAKNGFRSWLENLRDNSITKQRFWGTPVPIWVCQQTGDYLVIGSIKELEDLSGTTVKEIHIPHIDQITITKDGCLYRRIPDVLDVWIDAGTVSWNALNYPADKELFRRYFPADFILEGKDQIRGWFNLLMVSSFLALDTPSFRNVYMHGFITDISGEKMSKSLGNITPPDEITSKYGSDTLRYYLCQTGAGEDINFSWDECATKNRYLTILWNIHKLLLTSIEDTQINPFRLDKTIIHNLLSEPERYIFSRLNSTITKVTSLLDSYQIDRIIEPLETLYLELSRTYIQMVRDRLSSNDDQDKEVCLFTITHVLLETIKMFHIIAPFICEAIYLNIKDACSLPLRSLSEFSWPTPNSDLIDSQLEEDFDIAKSIIQAGLSAREKAQLGVRWPVKEIIVTATDPPIIHAAERLRTIIKQQINCRDLSVLPELPGIQYRLRPEYSKIGPAYGELSAQIIARLPIDSPQTIMSHFKKEGKHCLTIAQRQVEITPDMVHIESLAPSGFHSGTVKGATIYLDAHRTTELEAQGYSREISRSIQDQRKKIGLKKPDRIAVFLKLSAELKSLLTDFQDDLADRIGASKIEISLTDPVGRYQTSYNFKIKNENISVWISSL